MRNIYLNLDSTNELIVIGRRGENGVVQVVLDFSSWADEFGEGDVSLYVRRHGDEEAYQHSVAVLDHQAVWLVNSTDTAVKGIGRAEFVYTVGSQVAKSFVFVTDVMEDIGLAGETPGPSGTNDYNQLINKPKINGVTLSGDKSSEELGINPSRVDTYSELPDKPSINGVTLSGNKTTADLGITAEGLSNDVKQALLAIFEKVAYVENDGQTYIDALEEALYPRNLASISAAFNQGQNVIYDTAYLDDLRQYLTVTALYDDQTTEIVTDYTLSGTLTPGTSTIMVSYQGKTTTFSVAVTHEPGTFSIANVLMGCSTSNNAAAVLEGSPYSANITANPGYTLTGADVTIMMGGIDITSTAYSNGAIAIASVTAAVTITITAVAVTLSSISAVYTQSGTVYPSDSLDSLKSDLVVTAHYSDSSQAEVFDYTLSGTLSVGSSIITVSYGGKTTTFAVTVSAEVVLSSISAVYTQSGTLYANASLDGLKNDLVVTAMYSDSTTETVAAADYTLSGTIQVGTNEIIVGYQGKTATFNVVISDGFSWTYTEGLPEGFTILNPENGNATMTADGLDFKCTAGGGNNISLSMPESLFRSIDSYDYIFTVKPVTLSNASWASVYFKIADGAKSIVWVHFKTDGTFSKDVKINNYVMPTNVSHTVKFSGADVYVDGTKLATLTDIVETTVSRVYVGAAVSPTEFYLQGIEIVRR